MKKFQAAVFIISLIMLWQCANPVPPTGGPKDEIAPQVIKAESTPNGLTNYIPEETEITFDEFVVLRNPARNIIISPPVDPKPEFYLSGKTVVIDWTDVDSLRPNTTYTVNFANAVEDLNEGNPLTDFTFAFSTGPTLDSLQWRTKIIDKTGRGQKGVTVMLYDEMGDSVVRNQLPYYFAKTDDDGIAKFNYLKEGSYKVFAVKDENLTLTYDLPGEAIGFLKEPVHIQPDSSQIEQILLFTPAPKIILATPPFYNANKIVFLFTPPDTSVDLQAMDPSEMYGHRWLTDSLFFWPKTNVRDSLKFTWNMKNKSDTFSLPAKDSFIQNEIHPITQKVSFIKRSGSIHWSSPIHNPGDSSFYRVDSNRNKHFFNIEHHTPLKTALKVPSRTWPVDGKIFILPGQLNSPYGGTNIDTIRMDYHMVNVEELGKLDLRFSNAAPDTFLIVQLIQNDQVLQQQYFQSDTSYSWFIDNLRPGNYSLRMIVDENKNGIKDDGSYWEQQQPELPVEYKLPKLRANWTLEEEINIEHAIKGR